MSSKTGTIGSPNAGSDYYIWLKNCNGAEFPVYVLVRFNPQSTDGREAAPDPSNGFACEGSPFDKGHVCALELGGPDIPENIVPQWSMWQETGKWRRLESTEIPSQAKAGDLLLFEVLWRDNLEFGAPPPMAQQIDYDAYAAETLMAWDDYRIPGGFKVWVIPSGASVVKSHYTTLSAGLGSDDMQAAIEAFLKSGVAPRFTLMQAVMPEEDHRHLEQLQIVGATNVFLDVFGQAHEIRLGEYAQQHAAAGKMTKRSAAAEARKKFGPFRRADFLNGFNDQHAEVFRKHLVQHHNFEPGEVGHLTTGRIVAASGSGYHYAPAKRMRKPSEARKFREKRSADVHGDKWLDELRAQALTLTDFSQ